MKVVALVLLGLIASTMSLELDLSTLDIAEMIQTGTSSNDAVQAVYNLLNDLKQTNLEAQAAADQKNITDEQIGASVIGQLTQVKQLNQKAWQDAKDHRTWVEGELKDTLDFINWAHQRIASIDARTVELEEMRCFANNLFVRTLATYNQAVAKVDFFKQDLTSVLSGATSLVDIKVESMADKLKMYSNLFNQKALEEFVELATDQASGDAELHAQKNQPATSGSGNAATVGEQIYRVLDIIQSELQKGRQTLEQNEISASYHLSDWVNDSEAEKAHLSEEIDKATTKVEKLQQSAQAALATQAKANQILTESQTAIDQALNDLKEKRAFWLTEYNRRNEENAILDEVIHIFKEQVKDMANKSSLGKI